MDTEFIRTRRSIRKYQEKEIPNEILWEILDLARQAPSSMDSQPWEFLIIKDIKIKADLADLKGSENRDCILSSSIVVAVCVDTKKSQSRWVEDGVCATMNILLAANCFGLGAVYVTGYSPSEPKVTKGLQLAMGLPDYVIPVSLIPIGYPGEMPEKKILRELDKMVHHERW